MKVISCVYCGSLEIEEIGHDYNREQYCIIYRCDDCDKEFADCEDTDDGYDVDELSERHLPRFDSPLFPDGGW